MRGIFQAREEKYLFISRPKNVRMIAEISMDPRRPGPLRTDDEETRKTREIHRPTRHADITKPVADFVVKGTRGNQSETESAWSRALRAGRRLVIS